MNENINLCEILKGHEGEAFYSPLVGDVTLFCIYIDGCGYNKCIDCHINSEGCEFTGIEFYSNGHWFGYNIGECMLFPSKEQRDWNKWLEKQNSKVSKTWSEFVEKDNRAITYNLEATYNEYQPHSTSYTPIEKSALALLKIHQLVEVGYGGNVTKEEWKDTTTTKFTIVSCHTIMHGFEFNIHSTTCVHNIAFHTKEQAEEFLKYPENVQLLKDYFMI